MNDISFTGIVLYLAYPVLLISVILYLTLSTEVTAKSFFFGNRKIHWLFLGISFYSSTVVSPYLFAITTADNYSRFPYIYGIISVIMIFILGWIIAPKLMQLNLKTLPEYFEWRFNPRCRFFVSGIYILINILVRFSMILILANLVINHITGLDAYYSILFFVIITGMYIIICGMQAEVSASAIHLFFISIVTFGFAFWILTDTNSFSSKVSEMPIILKSINEQTPNNNYAEIIIGLFIVGFWFWCADQLIVQKVYSSGTVSSFKKASVIAAALQIIPFLISVMPGLLNSKLQDNAGIPFLNGKIIPNILYAGLIIAVISSLMTMLASLFNSTSTMITLDFYKKINPNSSDRKLVLVGRMSTIFLLGITIFFIPITQSITLDTCFNLFNIFIYFISMISAIIISGLFRKGAHPNYVFYSMVIISCLIVIKSLSELFLMNSMNELIIWINSFRFLGFAIFIFIAALILPFSIEKVKSLLFFRILQKKEQPLI